MKKLLKIALFSIFLMFLPKISCEAAELTPVTSTEGKVVSIKAKDGSQIGAIYIKWNDPVYNYTIETDHETIEGGANGFLHEFVPLGTPSENIELHLPEKRMRIMEIRIFEDTNVPDDVQIWQPPCDRADILLISSHSDDEILFMGGIIPTYYAEQGATVQVVYMTEFWSSAPVREHEKLDGLWTDGQRIYPVCANLPDKYAKDLAAAKGVYDEQVMVDYLTDVIRRFQPQVTVTHDFGGEYGHGFHMLTADAVALALDAAADTTVRTDTEVYQEKGAWDVPKAYFHLYPENAIHMDLRTPLESMGGQTALEVATAAYKQHVSQQWCWFYVSDDYEYSCADFGLYRTSVGPDTNNNMLDNIVTYAEQERLAKEEAERLAREQAEREEQERLQKEREEQEKLLRLEQEKAAQAEQERLAARRTMSIRIGAVALCITGLLIITITFISKANHRRKRRR